MTHSHLSRRVALAVIVVLVVPTESALGRPCWSPPTEAPVTDPFRDPECRWCPGNRGIEYGAAPGDPVRAVATGRVTFAGSVAGTRYVVVSHGDGLRVTYGNLASGRFRTGDRVGRGSIVGVAAGRLHFGVRDDDGYVDPTPLLGRLVYRPRLIPHDGSAANPASPPTLRCDSVTRVGRGQTRSETGLIRVRRR